MIPSLWSKKRWKALPLHIQTWSKFTLILTLSFGQMPRFKEKVLFFRTLHLGGSPFGPYVNRNHYAGLMEMLFPLVLAGFLSARPRSAYRKLRQRIADISSRPEANVYLLLGFAAVVCGVSIFLSLSSSWISQSWLVKSSRAISRFLC